MDSVTAKHSQRRRFLVAMSLLIVSPRRVLAQRQARVWRIGFLSALSHQAMIDSGRYDAFMRGMRELGYVEGENFVISWRFADQPYEKLPAMAAELVGLNPDVIVAAPSPAIRAIQKATTRIPIVMANTGDPVASGFVASLARPGGNITGLSNVAGDISAKYLELLKAVVPEVGRVGVLGSPDSTTHATIVGKIGETAKHHGIQIVRFDVRTPAELEARFAAMKRERIDAVIVVPEPLTFGQRRQIVDLAAASRLPAIYGAREAAEIGGLMSYAADLTDNYRRAATYVDQILKGAKPDELPVRQPEKFEFTLNLKTARSLGLRIPNAALLRADRVIN